MELHMCLFPKIIGHEYGGTEVSCGRCIECLERQSTEWAFRCVLEAKQHEQNCLITLTYKDEPPELIKKDYQDFLKRLRSRISPLKIRYFGSGEYGSLKGRPHYHFIIFGWKPDDLELLYSKGTSRYYKSHFLETVWSHGFVNVTEVTLDSAKYVAKYLQKMLSFKDGRQPPFTTQSTHPGIGFNAIDARDLVDDCIIVKGRRIPLPRYFLKQLKENGGESLEELRERRGRLRQLSRLQNTPERREARLDALIKKFGKISKKH